MFCRSHKCVLNFYVENNLKTKIKQKFDKFTSYVNKKFANFLAFLRDFKFINSRKISVTLFAKQKCFYKKLGWFGFKFGYENAKNEQGKGNLL